MSPHEVSCKTNMPALNHKIDFALIFTARNANPNGDPLDGNRPRTTYDGIGEVSDVCLKRKIRNRLMDAGYAAVSYTHLGIDPAYIQVRVDQLTSAHTPSWTGNTFCLL